MFVTAHRWRDWNGVDPATIAEGAVATTTIGGKPVLLVRVGGKLRAMADVCPHQGRSLKGGWVDDGHVVCPWHRFHYDPVTGKCKHAMTSPATAYPVRMLDECMQVGFPYRTIRILGFRLW